MCHGSMSRGHALYLNIEHDMYKHIQHPVSTHTYLMFVGRASHTTVGLTFGETPSVEFTKKAIKFGNLEDIGQYDPFEVIAIMEYERCPVRTPTYHIVVLI